MAAAPGRFGPGHPDLAVPAFNIANILCAATDFVRAVRFYRLAYQAGWEGEREKRKGGGD